MDPRSALKELAIGIFGWPVFSRTTRLLTSHGIRILGYHGFCDDDAADFQPLLFMRADTFRRRMHRLVNSRYRVISLSEAVSRIKSGNIEPDLVVITIDDGWTGIFEHALPVLRDLGLPSTVYVSTYYVDSQLPVVNVLIQYLLWRASSRVAGLSGFGAGIDGRHTFNDVTTSRSLATRLSQFVDGKFSHHERIDVLRSLGRQLDIDIDAILARRTFHFMTLPQLREAAASGMDLQLHTHRHRFPINDPTAATKEIDDNRRSLQAASGSELLHFCYPSGIFEAHQKLWLKNLGILSATTTRAGLCFRDTDPLELPRFLDSDSYSDRLFDAALSGALELFRAPASAVRIGRHAR